MLQNLTIRPFAEADWAALWPILRTTFEAGDTCAFAPGSTEGEIRAAWIDQPAATWLACAPDGALFGTYYIKPNQPGLGSHVCNCGYVVALEYQGQGIAQAMCEHSQQQAIALGFRAMQFNLVVQTNERAVRLWKRLGFSVVGALPQAFRHSRLGFVDALVMFKALPGEPVATADSESAASAFAAIQQRLAPASLSLQGPRVRLRELQAADAGALVAAAADGELWKLPFTVVPSAQTVDDYVEKALEGRHAGTVMPFVIELIESAQVIGSTRFWKIDRHHRKLEIGSTWLAASVLSRK